MKLTNVEITITLHFGKKFILDSLQENGKLVNDNRKWVVGFIDRFEVAKDYKVILEIEEINEG